MKKLFEMFRRLKAGEEFEFEITLEWYDLLAISFVVLGGIASFILWK
ncbi:hypothetical protein [Sphingobacterium sp.]